MSNSSKRDSPLVKSVLALDNYLSELERVGSKINAANLTDDFDLEYIQKLMARFAECGQSVSLEVGNLSVRLLDARTRAEAVAAQVAGQAELLNIRRAEQSEKLEKFRILGETVRELNLSIVQFRPAEGQVLSEHEQTKLLSQVPAFEAQLTLLIQELRVLRNSARDSRMKTLEKNAESLAQSLEAVRGKLHNLNTSIRGSEGLMN